MDKDQFHYPLAIIVVIFIHLMCVPALVSGGIVAVTKGEFAMLALTAIVYLTFLIIILFHLMSESFGMRLERFAGIDSSDHRVLSLVLFFSLFLFIFINMAGSFGLFLDSPEMLQDATGGMGSSALYMSSALGFFVFFLGSISYMAIAKGTGSVKALENLRLRISRKSILLFILGVICTPILLYTLSGVMGLIQEVSGFTFDENLVAISMASGVGIGAAFVLSAFTAVSEEVFFRGLMEKRIGIILTSLIFAFSHLSYFSLTELIHVFIFALVIGLVVERFDDLGFALGMHFTNNFMTFVMVNYFMEVL